MILEMPVWLISQFCLLVFVPQPASLISKGLDLFFFFFSVALHSLQDLRSLTRD